VIVVDTGPIAALINNRDNQHGACTELLAHHPGPLLVPAPVFTEVCMLLERLAREPNWPFCVMWAEASSPWSS
jgi:predicted nucleic acid-binding protein